MEKNCDNCRHADLAVSERPCVICVRRPRRDYWEDCDEPPKEDRIVLNHETVSVVRDAIRNLLLQAHISHTYDSDGHMIWHVSAEKIDILRMAFEKMGVPTKKTLMIQRKK